MAIFKTFALAALLATLTSAAPVQQQKRALVYETVTHIDVTTIDTTVTVFRSEATSAVKGNQGVTQVAAVTTTTAPKPSAPSPTTTTLVPETTTSAPPPPSPPAPETTTTTTAPPPPDTTTAAPPPPVTTTAAPPAPPSTTTSAPEPTGTGSGSGSPATGDGTFYQTATSLSAPSYCDTANDGSSENVVALSAAIMTQELCGKSITVTGAGGKTVTGTVVDRCAGCSAGSVDMSEHMFTALASVDAGRIPISWVYN
ncbi:uncharacterized protein TRUGW13939_03480 [Talaromyces rugulosus]|uniref:RlpA-like protein double-psi beta-barrel domain-containing protein n=1 Tax=Talaromyces rugulosus TaxID=121627 RepID=A0A7H8QR82_TALRU|nr:uncharacterized protein TRUGW13939_03480 [Talaromyces rugulosus]QKX56379.1 hypothetical protein TRUGW13939_03480 [Talaromyces rugulosus]